MLGAQAEFYLLSVVSVGVKCYVAFAVCIISEYMFILKLYTFLGMTIYINSCVETGFKEEEL